MRISVATFADVIKTRFQNNILYILQSRFANCKRGSIFVLFTFIQGKSDNEKEDTDTYTHGQK